MVDEVIISRNLLPLSLLRDHVPTAPGAKGKREKALREALGELDAGPAAGKAKAKAQHKTAAVTAAAAAVSADNASLGKRKPLKSRFESFFCAAEEDGGDDTPSSAHLLLFLSSKDLVALATASSRVCDAITQLKFEINLGITELARLGRNASSADRLQPLGLKGGVKRRSFMGILAGCTLTIGEGESNSTVQPSSIDFLLSFFEKAQNANTINTLTLHLSPSIDDSAIRTWLDASLRTATVRRVCHLSLAESLLQSTGIDVVCSVMKQGALPVLQSLNLARNNAGYRGIHKLAITISNNCCKFLSHLNIASNQGGAAVLDFVDNSFARKTPFLTHLDASSNAVDLREDDLVAVINRGLLTLTNYIALDLSFNPLGDVPLAKLLKLLFPINDPSPILLESLALQSVEMGVSAISYISQLLMKRDWSALSTLSIGANSIDLVGLKTLIEPLMLKRVPSLSTFSMPLNLINPEGVVLFQNAASVGALDSLVNFDISDVGANTEAIVILGRTLQLRQKMKQLRLRKLKLFGLTPMAGRNARVIFSKEFLDQVEVS